ncbi:unnamed protein product [Urochloa decumbens]|uniref:Serine protease n=1 Tax=Urochloa decumbens TaxID=240449 RepID=A0ABC9H883_9POAL
MMDDTGSTQSVRGQNEQKLYNELKSAVWLVRIETKDHTGIGTGFCIDRNGLIMTCAHCVSGNTCRVARQNDKDFQKAYLLHKIDSWDVAILCLDEGLKQKGNVPNNYPSFALAKHGTLNPGQGVYSISHQHRLMYSFSSGKISYPSKNEVTPFGKMSSKSSEKKLPMDIPTKTSKYRTASEISVSLDHHEDLPVIEMRNIHLGSGSSGGPIFLPTKEVVGMLSSGGLTRSYAVHLSALLIAFEEAKVKYDKLLEKLAAKGDEQFGQKSADRENSNEN